MAESALGPIFVLPRGLVTCRFGEFAW